MKKLLLVSFLAFAFFQLPAQDTLSKSDIPIAAKLLDLHFTQSEIDSMYDGVKSNLSGYQLMHKQTLSNGVPMTLWQSPVLPGMHFSENGLLRSVTMLREDDFTSSDRARRFAGAAPCTPRPQKGRGA